MLRISVEQFGLGMLKDSSVYIIAKIAKAFDVTIESLLVNE